MKHKAYMVKRGDRQWIVGVWDSALEMFRECGPFAYFKARAVVGRENCTHRDDCNHDHSGDFNKEGT